MVLTTAMKTLLFAALVLLSALFPSPDWEDSVPELCGVSTLEETNEEELDHFRSLQANPVDINHSSISALKSCGLFSSYQAASLLDYVKNTGDILSLRELSLLDGFSEEFVRLIAPFISIRSSYAPGSRKGRNLSQEINIRTDFNGYGAKYSIEYGSDVKANIGYNSASCPSFSIKASSGRYSVCIGDYNVRFGQGLNVWSGMSMSGISSSNQEKNPSGISPGTGFSRGSRLRGAALEYCALRFNATLCGSTEGRIAANGNFLWRSGQIGLSANLGEDALFAGLDFKQKVGSTDLFGEAVFSLPSVAAACLIGAQWQPEYLKRRSLTLRYYPAGYTNPLSGAIRTYSNCSDEVGASAATSSKYLTATVDASCRPAKKTQNYKGLIDFKPVFQTEKWSFKPQLRGVIRYRPKENNSLHTDLRLDIGAGSGALSSDARLQLTLCRGTGLLGYVQAGYESGDFKAEARYTAYNVRYWDDRIYVWQRDIPGSFNVPAFYGKGISASLWCSYKKALYLRASYNICLREELSHDWEIKLQYVKHFFHPYSPGAFDKNHGSGKRIRRKE